MIFLGNLKRPREHSSYHSPKRKFLILVPAHNESAGIANCIRSLKTIDYPENLYNIQVIADNCDDDTAQKARDEGALVWERSSEERKSKGYALEDAFKKYLVETDTEAFIVIDADTEVDRNLLNEFNEDLQLEKDWIQAYYTGSNVDASWRTRLMEWGFAVFNGSYLQGLSSLGLSVPLRGNGMCFSREGLQRVPWSCSGLAEDMEFGWELRFKNERVHFNPNARVKGEFVSQGATASSQRKRWEDGRSAVRSSFKDRMNELPAFKRFLYGFDLRMWPMAKLLGSLFLYGLLAFILARDVLALAIVLLLIVTLYVFSPFIFGLASPRLVGAAVHVPRYVIWKLFVKMKKSTSSWVRTTREAENSAETFDFCDLQFSRLSKSETVEKILSISQEERVSWIVTPNSDIVLRAQKDPKFKGVVQKASLLTPDGMPIVWASKILGGPIPERVTGADLLPAICLAAANRGIKVCFLGGHEGEAEQAVENFKKQNSNFDCMTIYPPMGFDQDEKLNDGIVAKLRQGKPQIVFVGVGSPKQEYWVYDNRSDLPHGVYLGVGMSISLAAGNKSRAPQWMQDSGLEWVYRIFQEPRRMIKRYSGNFEIFVLIFQEWRKKRR
ncbi:WecB/TagA/CpsF family glycosyltransferase [Pseudobacteriovorax antillogorgiicola]|uniref:WecB/TagA/CpsF family glycosyltransferase n=1 Tax=Pseudobacteriovorax antillogorgiicola TaxID=1513793 RepID=UPI001356683B|nr:WecB/TagA/CpsF family glycosyltransferase [Pseudobacteriovorax antillogorgiicola]